MFDSLGGMNALLYFIVLIGALNILDYKYWNLRKKFFKKQRSIKIITLVLAFIVFEGLFAGKSNYGYLYSTRLALFVFFISYYERSYCK